MNNNSFIEKVDTKNISNSTLFEMAKVQKDMWAYWLWEYIRCNCCNEIHSKNDIFWHLSSEIKTQSVTKLEEIFLWDSIKCIECNSSNTEFIYDIDNNVQTFLERYKRQSYLIILSNSIWDLVWFCDWYSSSLEDIYVNDLELHYPDIDLSIIEEKILSNFLSTNLQSILYFSSLWTYQNYSNIWNIFSLFKNFLLSINLWDESLWFTELDKNNPLYKIYKILWSISLELDEKFIKNTNTNYKSDLCIFSRDTINFFNNDKDLSLRDFISNNRIK